MSYNIKNHLLELSLKIKYIILSFFITTCVCYFYTYEIITILIKPLSFIDSQKDILTLYASNIFETYKWYIIIHLLISFHCNIPLVMYFIYTFMLPGLTRKQKQKFFFNLNFKFLIIIIFNILFYNKIIPLILSWISEEQHLNENDVFNFLIQLEFKHFIILLFKIHLVLNFIIFLIIWFYNQNFTLWILYKKQIYLIFLIVLAIITPPDVFLLLLSWIICCIFLEILHFIQIIQQLYFLKYFGKDGTRTHDGRNQVDLQSTTITNSVTFPKYKN